MTIVRLGEAVDWGHSVGLELRVALLACAILQAPASAEPRAHPKPAASAVQSAPTRAPARRSLDGMWDANFAMVMEANPKVPNLIATEQEAKDLLTSVYGAIERNAALDPEVPGLLQSSEGLPVVRGQRRTRLVVEPADGRLPYTAEARREVTTPPNYSTDNPEQRPSQERCLVGNGQPPMTTLRFAAMPLQIVQTPDQIVLHSAYGDDLRIVRLAGAHGPGVLYTRMGDSIAHWEGDTLVIETVGLPDADRRRLLPQLLVPGGATVIERLTPVSDDEILYQFTVIDPKTFTAPWRGEFSWFRTRRRIYEYSCHEGNYSLPNILSGARQEEAAKAAPASPAR